MKPKKQNPTKLYPAPRESESFIDIYSRLKKLGWGEDEFSNRVDSVFRNISISFNEFRGHYEFLKKSYELFVMSQRNLCSQDIPSVPVSMLSVRTFAALLGASMMASGGLLAEAMNLARSMLENAVYANYIYKNPAMEDVWLDRNESDDDENRCKNYFKWVEVIKHISPNQLKEEIQAQYKITIEFGAHPLPRASVINVTTTDSNIMSSIIHGDKNTIKIILCRVEKIAIAVFKVFRTIYPNTFKMNNLDIRFHALDELFRRIAPDAISGLAGNR